MITKEKFTVEVDTETATYTLRHPDGTVWSVGSLVDTPSLTIDICGMLSIDT